MQSSKQINCFCVRSQFQGLLSAKLSVTSIGRTECGIHLQNLVWHLSGSLKVAFVCGAMSGTYLQNWVRRTECGICPQNWVWHLYAVLSVVFICSTEYGICLHHWGGHLSVDLSVEFVCRTELYLKYWVWNESEELSVDLAAELIVAFVRRTEFGIYIQNWVLYLSAVLSMAFVCIT